MKYREHRGSLDESMKTVIEVRSKQQLLDHINKNSRIPITDITFDHAIYDPRINWDTWYVYAYFADDMGVSIVGMSDSNIFNDG